MDPRTGRRREGATSGCVARAYGAGLVVRVTDCDRRGRRRAGRVRLSLRIANAERRTVRLRIAYGVGPRPNGEEAPDDSEELEADAEPEADSEGLLPDEL